MIARLLGSHLHSTVQVDEIRELTEQFYVTLGVYFLGLAGLDDHPVTRRIRELLNSDDRSWPHAYEIEQLLVYARLKGRVTR
jgi:hypothetical protein